MAALLPGAPRIQSAGLPPELHANRVVGEMLRWISRTRKERHVRIREMLHSTPDGNARAQQKVVAKIREMTKPFLIGATLTPGKRGRFQLRLVSVDGWDPTRHDVILGNVAIPHLPWLACTVTWIKGRGRHQYDESCAYPFFATHHALSRLAQRCHARTAGDLILAVGNIWVAYDRARHEQKTVPNRLRFLTRPDEYGVALLKRYQEVADGEGAFKPLNADVTHIKPMVVATIIEDGDDTQCLPDPFSSTDPVCE
jgi:hypothetical protein